MEEAYTELYQQFLRLRSLCLRQAALLHQLTTALQKQQGTAVPNGELNDMMSIPVQCTQEIPMFFNEKPQPLAAAAHNPAAQCGVDRLARDTETFSNILAEDMANLSVDVPHQRKGGEMLAQKTASLLSLEFWKCPEALSSDSKTLGQLKHPGRGRTPHTGRMPLTGHPSVEVDFLNQCGGILMSDVALQSHICEFCQAVFPGDTTTRGEFLRHLHTHIS